MVMRVVMVMGMMRLRRIRAREGFVMLSPEEHSLFEPMVSGSEKQLSA